MKRKLLIWHRYDSNCISNSHTRIQLICYLFIFLHGWFHLNKLFRSSPKNGFLYYKKPKNYTIRILVINFRGDDYSKYVTTDSKQENKHSWKWARISWLRIDCFIYVLSINIDFKIMNNEKEIIVWTSYFLQKYEYKHRRLDTPTHSYSFIEMYIMRELCMISTLFFTKLSLSFNLIFKWTLWSILVYETESFCKCP